eukprot:NODE_20375_length_801_cov_2.035608.p2 GENE.NODE_20375_length_801_cov_2.035608~~NODE_20375_length_801_cov_2.035608.p2  ORF type:complete len:152 (-),score=33.64 NODE_20375_length_801_cov_2.035608:224-679(-)
MRKRKTGEPTAASVVASLVERRLPMSTMLFHAQTDVEDNAGDGPREYWMTYAEAQAYAESTIGRSAHVIQVKLVMPLHLLQMASDGEIAPPPRGELLAEADARGAAGVLLFDRLVVLLRPTETVVLIDDDKREGKTQELLTDMFTKMSLRA